MKQISQSANKLKSKRGNHSTGNSVGSTALVVKDDSSIVSAQTEGGKSLQQSVANSSIISGVRDSDSELSFLQKGQVEKFKLETCTVLVFIDINGALTEYPLTKRIASYTELQCEIARIKPKTRTMFQIQDINGRPLSSKDFVGYDVIRVKEVLLRPKYDMLKHLAANWEQTDFHEAVNNRPVSIKAVGNSISRLSHNSDDEDDFGF
jgi:hypothetical protein